MQQPNLKLIEEPPSEKFYPKHTVIRIDPADAERFFECFAQERKLLQPGQEHWMKDKDLSEIKDSRTIILGIEDQGKLVSGALLNMHSRQLVHKLHWYPWDAKSEHTAILGSVWTTAAHRGQGMGKAIIDAAIQEVQTSDMKPDDLFGGIRYILASAAENNIGSQRMFEKQGFNTVSAIAENPIHGQPMVYLRKAVYSVSDLALQRS